MFPPLSFSRYVYSCCYSPPFGCHPSTWMQGHTLLNRISGADTVVLTKALMKHVSPAGTAPPPLSQTDKVPSTGMTMMNSETLNECICWFMKQSEVIFFMKGMPENPCCGFSWHICVLLCDNSIEFCTLIPSLMSRFSRVCCLVACSYNRQPSPTASTMSFHQRCSLPLAVQTVPGQICCAASPLYHSMSQDSSPGPHKFQPFPQFNKVSSTKCLAAGSLS